MNIQTKAKRICILKIAGLSVLVCWLFYDSLWGGVCLPVISLLMIYEYKTDCAKQNRYQIEKEFCSGLYFAAGALEAGYSVENAWSQTEYEVTSLYGEGSVLVPYLKKMNQGVRMNQPLERLVWEFGQTSDSDVIRNFSEVFYFARKSGGNLTMIMRRSAERIRQNFQIAEEIQVTVSSKRLELLIMNVMPFAILAYLRVGSPEFMAPLYHNFTGVFVMSICLGFYFAAWILSKKIIQIDA